MNLYRNAFQVWPKWVSEKFNSSVTHRSIGSDGLLLQVESDFLTLRISDPKICRIQMKHELDTWKLNLTHETRKLTHETYLKIWKLKAGSKGGGGECLVQHATVNTQLVQGSNALKLRSLISPPQAFPSLVDLGGLPWSAVVWPKLNLLIVSNSEHIELTVRKWWQWKWIESSEFETRPASHLSNYNMGEILQRKRTWTLFVGRSCLDSTCDWY